MTQNQEYEFYRNHPYVRIYRDLGENSIQAIVEKINSEWNVGANPVKYTNVHDIVSRWLKLLYQKVNKDTRGHVPNYEVLMERYGISKIEAKLTFNRLKIKIY